MGVCDGQGSVIFGDHRLWKMVCKMCNAGICELGMLLKEEEKYDG